MPPSTRAPARPQISAIPVPEDVPGMIAPTPKVPIRARESAPPITPVTAASTRYTTKYDATSFDQTSNVPERMSPARLPRIGGPHAYGGYPPGYAGGTGIG